MKRMIKLFVLIAAVASAAAATTAQTVDEVLTEFSLTPQVRLDASVSESFTLTADGGVASWRDLASRTVFNAYTTANGFRYGTRRQLDGKWVYDMGFPGSGIDLKMANELSSMTVVMVADLDCSSSAFVLGHCASANSPYEFHRGANGEYAHSSYGLLRYAAGTKNGVAIKDVNREFPDGPGALSVYVFTLETPGRWLNLSQDRQLAGRNGGRRLAELMTFEGALDDTARRALERALMAKWRPAKPTASLQVARFVGSDYQMNWKVDTLGEGAVKASLFLSWGADAESLGGEMSIGSDLVAGATATATLTGLAAQTTYAYRLRAVNDRGEERVLTGTFNTLPSGYELLGWIQSTGTQFINTQYKHQSADKVVCDVNVDEYGQNTFSCLFGAMWNNNTDGFTVQVSNGQSTSRWLGYVRGSNSKVEAVNSKALRGQRITITCEGRTISWSNGLLGGSASFAESTSIGNESQIPLAIFTQNWATIADGFVKAENWYTVAKLYGFKVLSSSGTPRRDFVPCRSPAGEVGLYDLVTARFYGNEGTGHFFAPDDEGLFVSFAESTGIQWVDTGYAHDANTVVDLSVQFPALPAKNQWWSYFGARQNSSRGTQFGAWIYDPSGTDTYHYSGVRLTETTLNTNGWAPVAVDTDYAVHLEKNGDCTINGVAFDMGEDGSAGLTDYLFAINQDNAANFLSRTRLFSCQMMSKQENGRLESVRDFKPYRAANGMVGLLDQQTQRFHPVQGNGVLNWGGIAYTKNGTSLTIHEGTLAGRDLAGFTDVEKITGEPLVAGAVTDYPSFALRAGTLDLQDATAKSVTITNSFTLAGGTTLALDVTAGGADSIAAGSVVLQATAEKPVTIRLAVADDADMAQPRVLIASGLAADALEKFVLDCARPVALVLENGALLLVADDQAIASATWTGAGTDASNLSDPANWSCRNMRGETVAGIPGPKTIVTLPDGCVFNCPPGQTLSCQKIIYPATLGGDCDWRGLTAPIDNDIDLQGHTLLLGQVNGTGTIWDSADFQTLEYIEATGALGRQFIDTGYNHQSTDKVVLDINLSTENQTAWSCIFGAMWNNASDGFVMQAANGAPATQWLGYVRGANKKVQLSDSTNLRGRRIVLTCKGTAASWTDGEASGSATLNQAIGNNSRIPMLIFNENKSVTDNKYQVSDAWYTAGKLYSFQVYDANDVLKLDLVPVRRRSTGAAGLFDRLTKTFHGNCGPGDDFVLPAVELLGPTQVGEVRIDVPAGAVCKAGPSSILVADAAKLVKTGAGVWEAQDRLLAQVTRIELTDGTTKIVHGQQLTISRRGELVIGETATLDLNTVYGRSEGYALNEVTHGKKITLSGTIIDSAVAEGVDAYGGPLSHVCLGRDTAIGGETPTNSRIDCRPIAGSAENTQLLEGPYTLTLPGGNVFCVINSSFELNRLDSHGYLLLENTITGTITNGIHFFNGTTTRFNASKIPATIGFEVEEGSTTFDVLSSSQIASALNVKAGTTVRFAPLRGPLAWTGTILNNGTIEGAGTQVTTLEGRLEGVGTISGSNVRFGGNSCWAMAADNTGFTQKIDVSGVTDPAFFQGLKNVEITFTGDPSVDCCFEIGSAGNLKTAADITLTLKDAAGNPIENKGYLFVSSDGKLMFQIAQTWIEKAVWTGAVSTDLTDPANWQCTNGETPVTGVPMAMTRIVLPDGCTFNCPPGAPLVYHDVELPKSIGGDCDWRGLNVVLDHDLDLQGHKLTLANLEGTGKIYDYAGYELLEYIESTGVNGKQLINTGYCHGANDKVECDVMISTTGQSSWSCLFGAMWNNKTDGYVVQCAKGTSDQAAVVYDRGSDSKIELSNSANLRGTRILLTCQGATATWDTGTSSGSATLGKAIGNNSQIPMVIFNENYAATAGGLKVSDNWWTAAKLYRFRITTNDGRVMRDFVPARRLSDGKVGLLDLACGDASHGAFYENVGSGSFGAGAVTAVGANGTPGELHLEVAAGRTIQNNTVKFEGGFTFVKEGEGTFVANVANQDNFGGTRILGGTVTTVAVTTAGDIAHRFSQYYFGSRDSTISVATNAVLELSGNYDSGYYQVELMGGQMANHASYDQADQGGAGALTLFQDATLDFARSVTFRDRTALLNGHTLTILLGNGKTFILGASSVTQQIKNGILKMEGDGYLRIDGADKDLSSVNLDLNSGLYLAKSLTVHDLTVRYNGFNLGGGGWLKVLGTYTPMTDYRCNFQIMNGAVMDLSYLNSTLPGETMLSFADGATILVNVGDRHLRSDARLVSWEQPPNVTFKPSVGGRYALIKREDGLYYYRGLKIILR